MSYVIGLKLLRLSSSITRAFIFFFNVTAPTQIYTLSLHDALPIFVNALNSLCCSSRQSSSRLMQAWINCDATDKYQTYRIWNPGVRERRMAGRMKRKSRVMEL